MAIKTFNIDENVYEKFLNLCKSNGISMSKQVEFFMRTFVEEKPKVRKEYLEKLDRIRKHGKFIKYNSVDELEKTLGL